MRKLPNSLYLGHASFVCSTVYYLYISLYLPSALYISLAQITSFIIMLVLCHSHSHLHSVGLKEIVEIFTIWMITRCVL